MAHTPVKDNTEGKLEFNENRIDDAAKKHRSWGLKMPGICQRCNNSHIWKTERMPDPHVICLIGDYSSPNRVPIDVSDCNRFSQIGAVSVWELAKLALDVDISEKPRAAGFAHSKKENDE